MAGCVTCLRAAARSRDFLPAAAGLSKSEAPRSVHVPEPLSRLSACLALPCLVFLMIVIVIIIIVMSIIIIVFIIVIIIVIIIRSSSKY